MRTDCTVLTARADCLAVRVKVAGCSLLLVNLHGPHSQHTPKDIADWWLSVTALVRTLQGDDHLLVGGTLMHVLGLPVRVPASMGPTSVTRLVLMSLTSVLHLGFSWPTRTVT